MVSDPGFQRFGEDLADRMVVGLDLVPDDGLDGVDVGVQQHNRRGRAFGGIVQQLAKRAREARHQRILVGRAKALKVVSPEIEGLGRLGIVARRADVGLCLVQFDDLVL